MEQNIEVDNITKEFIKWFKDLPSLGQGAVISLLIANTKSEKLESIRFKYDEAFRYINSINPKNN
jgi:hypothetical protein